MNLRTCAMTIAGLLLLAGTCCASHQATIVATEDNEVRSGTYANTVQASGGAGGIVFLKYDTNTSFRRKGYIKFDLSSLPNPVDPDASAVLTFRYGGGGSGGGTGQGVTPYALIPGAAGANWSESTITWNNAPANNVGGMGFTSDAMQLAGPWWMPYSDPVGAIDTVTIPRLGDYIQPDNTISILLDPRSDIGTRQTSVTSSENGSFPGTQLTLTIIPEPTTLLIWSLLAGLGVGLRWRRRK